MPSLQPLDIVTVRRDIRTKSDESSCQKLRARAQREGYEDLSEGGGSTVSYINRVRGASLLPFVNERSLNSQFVASSSLTSHYMTAEESALWYIEIEQNPERP